MENIVEFVDNPKKKIPKPDTTVEVSNLPSCDFCGEDAWYDFKTKIGGAWANACESCFKDNDGQLGLGMGQNFILR